MSTRLPRVARCAMLVSAALAVACGGNGDGLSPEDQAIVDAADVAVTGTDSLEWEPETASAAPGTVTFALTCGRGVNHNLTIEGEEVAACAPGATVGGSLELEAGTHEYVCTVPGHDRRMRGTLTVG